MGWTVLKARGIWNTSCLQDSGFGTYGNAEVIQDCQDFHTPVSLFRNYIIQDLVPVTIKQGWVWSLVKYNHAEDMTMILRRRTCPSWGWAWRGASCPGHQAACLWGHQASGFLGAPQEEGLYAMVLVRALEIQLCCIKTLEYEISHRALRYWKAFWDVQRTSSYRLRLGIEELIMIFSIA